LPAESEYRSLSVLRPNVSSMAQRSYDDDALERAVADSHSWRGVLRQLGLKATSASAVRSVRRHAERLRLDASHFTGQRRWSDHDLAMAVARSRGWTEVASILELSGGSSCATLKGHAVRLGLDFTHFSHPSRRPTGARPTMDVDLSQLPRAGTLIAAGWFTLCGYDVSWPLEPCRYDLVVSKHDEFLRIQVKTTRYQSNGTWVARIQTGGRDRGSYDPDDIDYFFVINGDLVTT
jgi:hypothetical protein